MINSVLGSAVKWIQDDWYSHPLRFVVEIVAWIISIGCAVAMAATVPDAPLIILYPIWMTGCVMYAWAAWTRKSFGMLANYILLIAIDSVGLFRMIAGIV